MRWKLFIVGGLIGSLLFQTLIATAAQPDSLPVPFATQFDGSAYAATDCGPASVAMAINYATGGHLTPLQARKELMKLPGAGYAGDPESGTAIGDLARVALAHNVEAFKGDGQLSTGWGPERIRKHLSLGHPVIVLTRVGYLPGYKEGTAIDHYIILTGATASGYVYNDPALSGGKGRTISEKQLQVAQRGSSVPGQGAAFAGPPESPKPTLAVGVPNGPSVRITVSPGDTLSQLAERYGAKLDQVVALNSGNLKSVDHIEVGQVLNMPIPAAVPADGKAVATEAKADSKAEAPTNAKAESKAEPAADAKADSKPAPAADAKPVSKAAPAADAKPVSKAEPAPAPKASSADPKPDAAPSKPTAHDRGLKLD